MMRKLILGAQNIAEAFLDLAKKRPIASELVEVFPRNIEELLLFTVEIPVIYQQELTLYNAERYLCILRSVPYIPPTETDRNLLGLLCVKSPISLIFIRSGLNKHVQNYILAHELAHFLVDVFFIRALWMESLPTRESEILRAFAWNEYDEWIDFEAYLIGLPKRAHSIIVRGNNQLEETDEKEFQADLVARELLMPWNKALHLFQSGVEKAQFIQIAVQKFGLPHRVAFDYYFDLQRLTTPRPNLFTNLFSSDSDPNT
jgi:hypothetical protein